MSVVFVGDFRYFGLALSSLLFLLSDEVKAAHYDFDRCPCRGGLRPENPSIQQFFLIHSLRSEIIAPWKVSQFQKSPRIPLKLSVFYHHFQVSFFLLVPCHAKWTQPCKKLGSNINFISTDGGTINLCTILTPFPQWHLALIHCPDLPIVQRGHTHTHTHSYVTLTTDYIWIFCGVCCERLH